MKKKFTSKLKEKEILPLPLYYLDAEDERPPRYLTKIGKAGKINAPAYELPGFYKFISKF
ncbi:MAG: hypothetical protein J7623_13845 [Chitinophaga sp.]|uniref:hypothetical protein n=1 Tax=Chitinophaga sp. TaxID=1869181 RepID=UPI001B2D0283|nr:hypothetical protein [Chitinophaga sp.]MBO9729715.1 hypothetical protein [Chitinophaga sp.]